MKKVFNYCRKQISMFIAQVSETRSKDVPPQPVLERDPYIPGYNEFWENLHNELQKHHEHKIGRSHRQRC